MGGTEAWSRPFSLREDLGMQSLRAGRRRTRRVAALMSLAALTAAAVAGCSGAKPAGPAASPPPVAAAPAPAHELVLALHWNDALDTTRVLEARADQHLRVTVTVTGVDTLQGYSLRFRLEPLAAPSGDAWKFADLGGCRAAGWSFTAEPDRRAPAPWANKLLITDLKVAPDGTVWMIVGAAWDLAILDPDSVYSLCHLDFDAPAPAEEGGSCAGWDGPARIYCESGELMIPPIEFSIQRLGPAVTVRPSAAPRP
jgi:hypothetical protein